VEAGKSQKLYIAGLASGGTGKCHLFYGGEECIGEDVSNNTRYCISHIDSSIN